MKFNKKHLIIPTAMVMVVPLVAYAETEKPEVENSETTNDLNTVQPPTEVNVDEVDTGEVNNSNTGDSNEGTDGDSLIEVDKIEVKPPAVEEQKPVTETPKNPENDTKPSDYISLDNMTTSEIGERLKNLNAIAKFSYKGVNYTFSTETRQLQVSGTDLASINTLEITARFGEINVTSIADNAFSDKLINQVSIPDGIRTIGSEAFRNSRVKSLYLGNSVTRIGDYAFSGNNLQTLVLPSSVNDMGEGAFANGTIMNLTLNGTLLEIPARAFMDNDISLLSVPQSVRLIGAHAFENNGITDLVLMKGVTSIGDNAFANNLIGDIYIPSTTTILGNLVYYGNPIKSVVMPKKMSFYLGHITSNPQALSHLNLFDDKDDPGASNAPNVDKQDSVNQNDILSMQVQQGAFSIVKPKFSGNSFGTFNLGKGELAKELAFSSDLFIVDMTGSGKGWSVAVEASQFEEVKPKNGGVAPKGGWLKLPKGSLKIEGLGKPYKVDITTGNKSTAEGVQVVNSDSPIDNGPLTLLTADSKNAYGAFGLEMTNTKLVLNLDPSTTLVDSENYPNAPTPYTTTLTWTLTAGPGN